MRSPLSASWFLGLLTANLVPVMILALVVLGIEVTVAGLFTTVSLLATAAACMLSSRYCTSTYRKPVARIGSLIGGLGFLLAALAPSDWLFFWAWWSAARGSRQPARRSSPRAAVSSSQ